MAQSDRCENRQLRGGIGALHVFRRIRFRVPGNLRLGERQRERHTRRFHAAQHVCARTVEHTGHVHEPVTRKPFLERAKHRDAAGDGGLEAQLQPARAGELHQFRTVVCDQLLVRGDDGLAGNQRRANPVAGRLPAADDLDHDVDVGCDDVGHRFGPAHRRGHPVDLLSRNVAIEDVREADARDVAAAQDVRNRLPDGSKAEQRDARRLDGGHQCRSHDFSPETEC
jgi:hypothetical protein